MNKKILGLVVIVLLLAGTFIFAEVPFSFSDPDWKARQSKTIVVALEERVTQTENDIDSFETQIDNLETKVDNLEKQVAQLDLKNQSLKSEIYSNEQANFKRSQEMRQLLLQIILLLKSK